MLSTNQLRRSLTLKVSIVFCLVLALGAGSAMAQGDVRIAVVNLDYVVAQSPGGQALQAQLTAFQGQVQAEAKARADRAQDIRTRMAEGANSLSEEKLTDLQKEFEDISIEMRRFRDDKEREGQKMQTEGLQAIEKELEPVFSQVRDEGGYDLILNNVPGVVVMSSQRIDITQKVLDKLKAAAGS